MTLAQLFDPVTVGSLALRNRTVMAPMTRRHSPGGIPTAQVCRYYQRRAQGGVGMIVSEGLAIDHPTSVPDMLIPNLYDPAAIEAWRTVVAAVQEAGAAFVPQLWHIGGARYSYQSVLNAHLPTLSASGIYRPGKIEGAAADEQDIRAAILSYGRAARVAMDIGCNGINLHGAHGYLLDGFFWEDTNRRKDAWGGGIEQRTRFACEVVKECRRQTRPDFPIMLRFSQFKLQDYDAKLCTKPDELQRFLAPLVDAGVDIFDCSTRRFWTPEFPCSDLSLAGWTRKLSGKPTMAVGSVGLDNDMIATMHQGQMNSMAVRLDRLDHMLARGDFDLVGIGRALISDPDWVAKVKLGQIDQLKGFHAADLEALI